MNYLYFKKEDGEHLKIKLIDSCREDRVLITNILPKIEKESQCLLNSNLMVHRYRKLYMSHHTHQKKKTMYEIY